MKNVLIILGIIFVLVFTCLFAGVIPLNIVGGEYHTGISMYQVNNCETEHHKCATTWVGWWEEGSWYGNIQLGNTELINVPFNNGPVVTAMVSGEGKRSMPITMNGDVTFVGLAYSLSHWWPDTGWYTVEYSTNGITWTPILDTSTGSADSSMIGDISGPMGKQKYCEENTGGVIPIYTGPTALATINPVSFNIKDSHVGALRIRQITEFKAWAGAETSVEISSTDYVFLISGAGDVKIVDPKVRYIAGEDTIRFKVDTGYSGITQDGTTTTGWDLKIYNNNGNCVKTWEIDDDKFNCRYDRNGNLLDYDIPSDAVEPGQSHTWSVVLTNKLFNQDDETFFAITQEELEGAPDIVNPIKFSKKQYEIGDDVVITLEGIPNPDGRDNIDGFLVNIMYGTDGTDYILNYHNKYVKATGDDATISFTASKGDTYITVEAWAFDYPESQGGIMSETATGQVWIKEKLNPPIYQINWLLVAILALIMVIGVLIGVFMPNIYLKIAVPVIIGIVCIIIYLYLGGGMF